MTLRSVFATVTVMAALSASAASSASAQSGGAASRRVQAVPPAEGAFVWGRDQCLYRYQGGVWRSQNVCRPARTTTRPRPTSRQPRQPTASQAAAEAELANLIRQLNQLTATAQPRAQVALPSGCAPFAGQTLAPNVRVAIPNNPSCRTPEEKAHVDRVNLQIITGGMVGAQRHACEMGIAGQPIGPNGQLNDGWYDTATGPKRRTCP